MHDPGIRTLEELLKLAPGMYDITVFGAEPHRNYNRILLSPVLAGEQDFDDIVLHPLSWYADNGIALHLGKEVVRIDRAQRKVVAADGTGAEYDRLLLATGSLPFILPVPGKDQKGVIGYRDIHDTRTMIEAARVKKHAVVIGGGLLGLEAANGLKLRGMQVTVVHLAGWLLEQQLDPVAGALLEKSLRERGLDFRLNTSTTAIVGNEAGEVAAVRFSDGAEIPAELVVMAAGIRPNIALAQAAGIHCDRGVVVTDTLQAYDPRVYAVGECASRRGVAYGLVAPLFEQARICADQLATWGIGIYRGSAVSTKLKVTGANHSRIKSSVGRSAQTLLMPGTTLIREWDERQHRVTVTPEGLYELNGQIFKSLSAAARHITGTQWNGPKFFGLRDGKAGGQ